jgi:SWI/SNF-related matrix-associated actin-dependent regulator of chromatin subfamily A-like protein 1
MKHQQEGVDFALKRRGSLLGMEQGTGKTAVAIITSFSWLCLNQDWKSVLVVCPSSLRINWMLEISNWMESWIIKRDWTVGIVADSNSFPDATFTIVSYDMLHRPGVTEHVHREEAWDIAILDEAQYIQSMTSIRCRHILGETKKDKATKSNVIVTPALKARRKLALSGTPLMNKVINLYPILKWLAPQDWDYWPFAVRYCGGERGYKNSIMTNGASNIEELHRRLTVGPKALLYRVLKKDVLLDLPDKLHKIITLPAPQGVRTMLDQEKKAHSLHRDILAELRSARELASLEATEEHRMRVLALRKQRSDLFGQMASIRKQLAVTKAPLAISHLSDILDSGVEKILLFGTHREPLASIADALSGYGSQLLLGGTDAVKRNEMVVKFQTDPSMRVFVLSSKAGGTGLTLHAASYVVMFEPEWTDASSQQCVDRAHRYGQTRGVVCDWLCFEESLDVKLLQTSLNKASLAESVIDGKASKGTTPDEPTKNHNAIVGENMSDAERRSAHEALRRLCAIDIEAQGFCNGGGFAPVHRDTAHALVAKTSPTTSQYAVMRAIALKYRNQLHQPFSRELQKH